MTNLIRYESYGRGERPVIRCDCGREIFCIEFTNTCENCGSDYNSSGQLLSPREFWGEETGEHPADCIGPFGPDDLM